MPYNQTRQFAAQLMIDLPALASNYKLCQTRVGPHCEVAAAVKADAYGIGISEAAPVLAGAGCKSFFVATLEEGIELRALFGSAAHKIYILNGLQKDAEDIIDFHSLTPVINSLHELELWAAYAKRTRPYLKCALHIDTGMARLGLTPDELEHLQNRIGEFADILDIEIVMSHFACADEKGHPFNEIQAQKFQNAADSFVFSKFSLANSSGLFRKDDWHYDMVRPGMCLYGLNPTPETDNPMKPVVKLAVPILQRRPLPEGKSVGYGADWVAASDTELATIQLGYADGFARLAGNKAKLYWQGHPCPVVGRVSMDLSVISLENVPRDLLPHPGDMIEVFGPHQSVDDLACDMGTIGYELLTMLGKRYNRRYER
ncbi:MAG: alanine racemase [Micavibrio sp.]|nr:alanine racemase [Micavibrio sp.]|tara:strand:- start:8 stop:1126 length:1119 start_codon:yes stop_codon:yes gene_type:complete